MVERDLERAARRADRAARRRSCTSAAAGSPPAGRRDRCGPRSADRGTSTSASAAPTAARARWRPRSRCCGACPRTRRPDCRARRSASRRGAPPRPGKRMASATGLLAGVALARRSPPSSAALALLGGASPSPTSSVSSSISASSSSWSRGGVSVAITVSGSSRSVTPAGARDRLERHACRRSPSRRRRAASESGMSVGQRLDRELAGDLLEHPALLDAGRAPRCRRARARPSPGSPGRAGRGAGRRGPSSPLTGWRVSSLSDDRRRAGAVDAQVEHGAGVRPARGAARARRPGR